MLKWITVCLLIPMLAAGQVMEFDGVDQYVVLDETVELPTGGSDITWAAWVYPTDWNSSLWSTIIAKAGAADYKGWFFGITGDGNTPQGRVHLRNQGNFLNESSTGAIALDEWTHVAAVFHDVASTADFYINGEYDSTDAVAGDSQTTAISAALGVDSRDLSGYEWEGMFDDVRVYASALSSNEIARLTLDTCEMYDPTLCTNATLHAAQTTWETGYGNTNLVGAWRGDRTGSANGETFSAVPDISDNGNDGTAYNSPTIEAAR